MNARNAFEVKAVGNYFESIQKLLVRAQFR